MAMGMSMGSDHKLPTISENSDAKPAFAAPEGGGFLCRLAGTFAVAAMASRTWRKPASRRRHHRRPRCNRLNYG